MFIASDDVENEKSMTIINEKDEIIGKEKSVKLLFYKAKLLSEKIELLEHENYKWITKDQKCKYKFAGADEAIFDLI